MRLDLHARVLTRDGEPAGNLDKAIVDPRTNEVTDFVVSTGGFFGKDVIVSHEDIHQASADGDLLRLRLDKADLERLPTYEPVEYGGPPAGWVPPAGYGCPSPATSGHLQRLLARKSRPPRTSHGKRRGR